jgi:hypothetical protein
MEKIFFIIGLLFVAFGMNAQTVRNDYDDAVYLKSGSKFVGRLTYYKVDSVVNLELKSGEKLSFVAGQVQKIVQSESAGAVQKAEKPYIFREKGWYGAVYSSFIYGRNFLGEAAVGGGANAVFGRMYNQYLGVGVGTGIDYYYLSNSSSYIVPIFAEVRGYLSKKNISEYYSVRVGYGFPIIGAANTTGLSTEGGGMLLHPAFGWRFGGSNRYNFSMDIGAQFQNVAYSSISQWQEDHYTINYARYVLRMGLVF